MQNIQEAFQDGCDTIVAGCTTYGSTPASNSPEDIVKAIEYIASKSMNTLTLYAKGALQGGYYSSIEVFEYDNTDGFTLLTYEYYGSCKGKINCDDTTVKSFSAKGWGTLQSGSIDISTVSNIRVYAVKNTSTAESMSTKMIFTK